MSNIGWLSTQDGKVGKVESLQPSLIFATKYGVVLPATESIESGLESSDFWEKTEQQPEEDPAEPVNDDASAFGSELNFHDDSLTVANESQNISKTSISD